MTARILALGLSALTLLGPASAQSNVAEGLWSYDARYMIGPFPARDGGQYCVGPDMAETSYDALFNQINSRCRVTESDVRADGYHFTLQCAGGPEGVLNGRLIVGGNSANLSATGWTGAGENNVPVILSASAKKLSPSCS